MAIAVDWATLTFSIPQGDLTLVVGTLYELDTEVIFRQEINAIMAGEEGIVFEDPISHNTEVTVAGVTFARTIEVINSYNVTFTPDAQFSVRLAGSNNNIFDVENNILNQNQVQVIAQNSAGLIVTSGGGGGLTGPQDETLTIIRKILQNRTHTDPSTGIMTIFDDDDATPLFTGNIYQDVAAATLYNLSSKRVDRRNRLT